MTQKIISLPIHQARKLVLLSQAVPPVKQKGSALDSSLRSIEHLGYIQIDTISAVQRAHHHIIWSRNPRYQLSHLDDLTESGKVFEYWSHAAAYLPMKDYRFTLPRKIAILRGDDKHWYEPNTKLMNSVLNRVRAEGPLMAKDFNHHGGKLGEWQSKPAKQALETLFMQGELMVSKRTNFHKVYELTEKVLPSHVDTSVPGKEEHLRFLINRYLKANGIGQAGEIAYLRKNTKEAVTATLKEMTLSGELVQLDVQDNSYYALPPSLELLDTPLSKSKLKILSPFDNLLIQRKRMKDLFGFDYFLECYVPEAKRKYGYFVLPILWDGKLVARMDCKADRKTSVLNILQLNIEPWLKKREAFALALSKELEAFRVFNACERIRVHKINPEYIKTELQRSLQAPSKL